MLIRVSKGKRSSRFLAAHKRKLRVMERKFQPVINAHFKELTALLMKNVRKATGKTPAKKVNNWIDWDAWMEHEAVRFKPELLKILAAGGEFAFAIKKAAFLQHVTKQDAFDPITTESVKWATKRAAELVVEITETTRQGLQKIIVDFIPAGKNLWNYQKKIRPLIGLIEKHVIAVSNFQSKLLEEGIPADKVARLVERKATKLLRWREKTIARTETAYAQTHGQIQGYDQLGFKSLERVEDPDCCDICAEFNGKIYPIDETEGVLPEHPNCEGTWVPHAGG